MMLNGQQDYQFQMNQSTFYDINPVSNDLG